MDFTSAGSLVLDYPVGSVPTSPIQAPDREGTENMKRFLLALGMTLTVAAGAWSGDQAPTSGAQTPTKDAPVAGDAAPPLASHANGDELPSGAPHLGDVLETATKERLWVTGDYLFTWIRGERLPILATTSPAGTQASQAGVIGQPGTSPVIGDDIVHDTLRSGARFAAGYWLLPRALGIEAGFMWAESEAASFTAASDGSTILARPFFDASNNGAARSALIGSPGTSSGNIAVSATSGNFYEGHVDAFGELLDLDNSQLTMLLGYRFFRYDDGLSIRHHILATGGNFVAGTTLDSNDSFTAQNEFHGVDFGLRSEWFWGEWSLEVLAKIAVGEVGTTVKIRGSQIVSVPGTTPLLQTGGLYALASNIGDHSDDQWDIMPEVGLKLGWRVTSHLQVNLGYSLLWLNGVGRAADQIDFNINPALLPPAQRAPAPDGSDHPTFSIGRSDVWLQSITFGATYSY
jgi:hypothetical protein